MRFYISTKGIKRVTISNSAAKSGGAKSSTPPSTAAIRRFSSRTWFPVVIVIGIVLSFLFVRVAFLVLESASRCNSSLDCMGWSFFDLRDTSLRLSEELTRAMVEAKETNTGSGVQIQSFNELVKEITSNRQDIKAFAITTKAMLSRMEHNVQLARLQQSVYWHLASLGVPKSLHCLCLKLAEEYAVNAMARCRLPPPEYVYRLVDPSYHHVVLLTDNVIAASVVVSSTVQNSGRPEKLVFHVVTDKKTYTSMHAWFALNHIASAVVEVKGLHQYDWSREVNDGVKEMLEINRMIWRHYYDNLEEQDFLHETQKRRVKALSSSSHSLLNHLQIYLAELFPDLKRVVLLDDDVVVQHDISSLWELDLNGKVVGAVVDSCGAERIYGGRRYEEYLNFSHPLISSNFDRDRCAWLFGMNVFDLEAWRRANITESHLKWLKLNLKSGLELWQPGFLPPVLLAFDGQLHPIDPSWHVAGLGYYPFKVNADTLKQAAVLHFSGPAKPWHEIGFPEVRSLWNQHVNSSNKFVRECSITG